MWIQMAVQDPLKKNDGGDSMSGFMHFNPDELTRVLEDCCFLQIHPDGADHSTDSSQIGELG